MTIYLLTGGASSGKSDLAQDIALACAKERRRYYLATMIPTDEEDRARIRRHRQNRAGMGFITVEKGSELRTVADSEGWFLVDSLTALLANLMFQGGAFQPRAAQEAIADLLAFCDRVAGAVLVSDSIGCDGGAYDAYTVAYIRALAEVEKAMAKRADAVAELVAGLPLLYKGVLPSLFCGGQHEQ